MSLQKQMTGEEHISLGFFLHSHVLSQKCQCVPLFKVFWTHTCCFWNKSSGIWSVDKRTFLSYFNTGYFCDLCYNLTPQIFVLVIWMCKELWHKAKSQDTVLNPDWSCTNHLQEKNISQRSLFFSRCCWRIHKRSMHCPILCSSIPGVTPPGTSVYSLCHPKQSLVSQISS